jgi:hypothetical protein
VCDGYGDISLNDEMLLLTFERDFLLSPIILAVEPALLSPSLFFRREIAEVLFEFY